MKCNFLLFLLLATLSLNAQELLTFRELTNVYSLIYHDSAASCFKVTYNQKLYLVTAKHAFPGLKNREAVSFDIRKSPQQNQINGTLWIHRNEWVDIAVIEIAGKVNETEISLETRGIELSDQGFFVGFPLNISSSDLGNVNQGFPIPLIKRATFSGAVTENGASILLLDGNNNHGFSGGPFFFKSRDQKDFGSKRWFLGGVISGYIPEKGAMKTKDGALNYDTNSGIIIGYAASHIIEIIKQNQ